MSVHWREMDTSAKIAAIQEVFEPGMSASEIAAHFSGATRNAVIGLFHRHLEKIDGELRSKKRRPKGRVALRRPNMRTKPNKPLPQFDTPATETHLCGRPLIALQAKQCRWPVNDAEKDGHLFCGMPADGSYCEHHAMRSIRGTHDDTEA